MTGSTAMIALRDIWMVFDGVPVLRGIDFDLWPGEIHALLGGNGSGKSTTVKILSGTYRPTAGRIEVAGAPVTLASPAEAHDRGIYMVPQEPHIFPSLSVQENLTLGLDGDPARIVARARALANDLGLSVDFAAKGAELSIANQQLVEILRGLLRDARVLILDEPTSSLTRREVDSLAHQMRRLTAQGIAILFISHRLDEVLDLSNRVSVLRDGGFVLSSPASELTAAQLVEAMLPADFAAPAESTARLEADLPTVLEVRNLSGQAFRDVSLTLRAGEVLGIAGVVGSGRTELAEAIYGIEAGVTGEVMIAGQAAENRTPLSSMRMGLAYLPEDRHAHGLFLNLPSAETIVASVMALGRRDLLSQSREDGFAQSFVNRLRIKLTSPRQIARSLSGGNQQKLVLARILAIEPRAVILDEPTRGIDARARQDVYRIIRDLTASGVGVIVISSEMGEIVEIADRVMIMKRGRLAPLATGPLSVARISAATFDLPPVHEAGRMA
jgi:AI-2 transport system ATP-binding protein